MSQTLTKSRFIQGLGCPQKLIYGADKAYLNRSDEDSFLASLARGGFQVGEFAKAHFPGGFDITTLDQQEALDQTRELLDRESATIFEAAIQFENCFIRVDVMPRIFTKEVFYRFLYFRHTSLTPYHNHFIDICHFKSSIFNRSFAWFNRLMY